jgi:hypothetical protein
MDGNPQKTSVFRESFVLASLDEAPDISDFPRNVVEGTSPPSTEFLHPPFVEFHTVTEVRSFDWIELVREVREEVIVLTLSRMTPRNCTVARGSEMSGSRDSGAGDGFSLQSKES